MIAFLMLVFPDIIKQFFLVREDPRNGLVSILLKSCPRYAGLSEV